MDTRTEVHNLALSSKPNKIRARQVLDSYLAGQEPTGEDWAIVEALTLPRLKKPKSVKDWVGSARLTPKEAVQDSARSIYTDALQHFSVQDIPALGGKQCLATNRHLMLGSSAGLDVGIYDSDGVRVEGEFPRAAHMLPQDLTPTHSFTLASLDVCIGPLDGKIFRRVPDATGDGGPVVDEALLIQAILTDETPVSQLVDTLVEAVIGENTQAVFLKPQPDRWAMVMPVRPF